LSNRTLFLTLKVFAATGGIEKVCRVAGKALYEKAVSESGLFNLFAMYDKQSDADENRYFPSELFRGFTKRKIKFILHAVLHAKKYDVIILSHINLLLVGWLIKWIYPRKKLVLFAHGIEVWGDISRTKKNMLKRCDMLLAVSRYTGERLVQEHGIPTEKIEVLNNCLDPFLPLGKEYVGSLRLRAKYGFQKEDIILFALTRISSKERYKGYDKVLQSLVALCQNYPTIKYLIAGSHDEEEKKYLDTLTEQLGLAGKFKMAGFIPDEELVEHFLMSDMYVMPSMKEGFGIVFIEAMYYNLPVIAGNKDGSVDALLDGALGRLVDPMDIHQIAAAVEANIIKPNEALPDRNLLLEHFSYEAYKANWDKLIKKLTKTIQ
jgi:glycosyltransferase involved in cell wall biosynthesis